MLGFGGARLRTAGREDQGEGMNTWCPGGARRRPRWRVAEQDSSDGRGDTGAAEGGRRAGAGREDAGPEVVVLDRARSLLFGLRRGERMEETDRDRDSATLRQVTT
jgi:hypothetical protein